ncbi:hypothetical protein PGT21_027503 [Puccinia graminis f. sp. tritici]|uniref:Uncharacterized protein n=1 Tax=Puccinia graminis f. sp. tritici TaxID=56615 RepID=A0A5B0LQD4_PUCGR|nr:hypothetical protein PGT21_027503 [Puccinia graminis f. sp. tritici]KAA1128390.1 hypothetical protein PGTUg99_020497 [Puccinia graminis f. sp. tritici]
MLTPPDSEIQDEPPPNLTKSLPLREVGFWWSLSLAGGEATPSAPAGGVASPPASALHQRTSHQGGLIGPKFALGPLPLCSTNQMPTNGACHEQAALNKLNGWICLSMFTTRNQQVRCSHGELRAGHRRSRSTMGGL